MKFSQRFSPGPMDWAFDGALRLPKEGANWFDRVDFPFWEALGSLGARVADNTLF